MSQVFTIKIQHANITSHIQLYGVVCNDKTSPCYQLKSTTQAFLQTVMKNTPEVKINFIFGCTNKTKLSHHKKFIQISASNLPSAILISHAIFQMVFIQNIHKNLYGLSQFQCVFYFIVSFCYQLYCKHFRRNIRNPERKEIYLKVRNIVLFLQF